MSIVSIQGKYEFNGLDSIKVQNWNAPSMYDNSIMQRNILPGEPYDFTKSSDVHVAQTDF